MPFNSLSNIVTKQIVAEARRSMSSQVRLNTSASVNLGMGRLLNVPQEIEANAFIWGTNQGIWGDFKITNQYKP